MDRRNHIFFNLELNNIFNPQHRALDQMCWIQQLSSQIKVFWKYCPYDTIETWIIPHKAVWSFAQTFLDKFDVFKSVPAQATSENSKKELGSYSQKKSLYSGGTLEEKKLFNSRHLRVSNYTKHNFALKYPFKD